MLRPLGVLLLFAALSSCVSAPPFRRVAPAPPEKAGSAAPSPNAQDQGARLIAESLPSLPSPGSETDAALTVSLTRLPTPEIPPSMLLPLMPQLPPGTASAAEGEHRPPQASQLPIEMRPTAAVTSAGPPAELPSPAMGTASAGAAQDGLAGRGGTAAPTQTASVPLPAVPSEPSDGSPAGPTAASTGAPASTSSQAPGSSVVSQTPSSSTPAPPAAASGGQSASGGASSAGPSKGAGGKTRTVYARVGDDITIALNGNGWTFTGGGASGDKWKSGVQYENRTNDSSGTTFMFKAKSLGSWVLEFQKQDSTTGASSGETIDLHVLSDQQFAQTIAAKGGGSQGTSASTGSGGAPASQPGGLARADWLYKEGKYKEALDAYEAAWTPNDPALTDKIAELAYRVGRYGDAHKYWQKNFGLTDTTYGELAVAGLMKTATAQKNAPELRALFDYVHALKGVPIRADLLATAEYLYHAKDWEVAQRYLDEYLSRFDGQEGADAADFLLGQIYQGDTPMQNAQKALAYYRKIVTYYPTSDYYERAKANINYLNRHFFEIR